MSDLAKQLGRRIHLFRKQNGLTQAALAEKVKISNEFISGIERGAKLPPAKQLYDDYVLWCGKQKEIPVASNLFSAKLDERGIERKRTAGGVVYLGLGVLPMAEGIGTGWNN